MEHIENKKRNVNIDLLKLIACILIVGMHSIKPKLGALNYCISIFSTVAIPCFFMVSGYLQFGKNVITSYIIRKITKIVIVCLSWELLHSLAEFVVLGEWGGIRNILSSLILDFIQQGLFFHFWFLGAMIILYCLLPILQKCKETNPKLFIFIFISSFALCVVINACQFIVGTAFLNSVIQTFRIWIWIFYFILGSVIAKQELLIRKYFGNRHALLFALLFASAIEVLVFHYYLCKLCIGKIWMNDAYYGSISVITATMLMFVCILCADLHEGIERIAKFYSGLTMGIYIFHPFIFPILIKFIPLFAENQWMNLLLWLLTFGICTGISYIVSKMPILRELIKL